MAHIPSFAADCSACAALCCMAFAFDKGDEFAADKPACAACPNLDLDFRCTIHDRLAQSGFPGCVQYDCLGAGQRVIQEVFAGKNWRDHPTLMIPMAEAFAVLRQIHRDLELLLAARALPLPDPARAELNALIDAHTPEDGWTVESLNRSDASARNTRTSTFLRSLRAYV